MSLKSIHKLLASLSLFACTSLFATPLVVDVSGVQSVGLYTDPTNEVLTFDVGANARITHFALDVDLRAFGTSWLSEMGLAVSNTGGTVGFFYNPAAGDDTPGSNSYAGSFDLTMLGLDFNVGADGILRIEFYEDRDDVLGTDGQWNFGTLTFEVVSAEVPGEPGEVPEPASLLLLAAGLGAMGYAGRCRALARRA